MSTSGWLLGIAGVAVGQLLAVCYLWVQRKWARTDLSINRREERADEAARNILGLLEQVRDVYSGMSMAEAMEIPSDSRYDLCHRIDLETQLLPDKTLRAQLGRITAAFWSAEAVSEWQGDSLPHIASVCCRAGQELVGARLRREPLPTPGSSENVARTELYAKSADDYNAMMEAAYESERQRRRAERAQAKKESSPGE
jgi:hypothetical protein